MVRLFRLLPVEYDSSLVWTLFTALWFTSSDQRRWSLHFNQETSPTDFWLVCDHSGGFNMRDLLLDVFLKTKTKTLKMRRDRLETNTCLETCHPWYSLSYFQL